MTCQATVSKGLQDSSHWFTTRPWPAMAFPAFAGLQAINDLLGPVGANSHDSDVYKLPRRPGLQASWLHPTCGMQSCVLLHSHLRQEPCSHSAMPCRVRSHCDKQCMHASVLMWVRFIAEYQIC